MRNENKEKQTPPIESQDKLDQSKSIFDNLEQSPWMTAKEAADYLKFENIQQLYDALFRGQIKASRIGRRLRFNKNQLDQWLLSQN